MKKDRECKYCKQIFENIDGRVFSNHVRWCDKNTTNNDKGGKNISESLKNRTINRIGDFKDFEVICHKCNKKFTVKEREKKFPMKEKYFCSRSCANSRKHSKETKEKIRKNLQKKSEDIIKFSKVCPFCKNNFETFRKDQKCCSISCAAKNRYKHIDKTTLHYYRQRCIFQFNLADYPDEFDFDLIRENGWYKAKNHGDNPNGVSRDHIISVKYGYENEIDPKIISHPANCRLMKQSDNASKSNKCDITLEELLEKIEKWDKRYN